MSLFTQNYSPIITNGLGGPACCVLLTASFGLVCGCHIVVVSGAGGGGPYPPSAVNPGLIPADRIWTQGTKIIVVKVNMGEHKWEKHYVVDDPRAKYVITAVKIINTVLEKVRISVAKIKHISKKVIAVFRNK